MTFTSERNINCHECNSFLIQDSHELTCSNCGLVHDDILLHESKNFDLQGNSKRNLFINNTRNTLYQNTNYRMLRLEQFCSNKQNAFKNGKLIISQVSTTYQVNESLEHVIINDFNYYLTKYYSKINSVLLAISLFYYHYVKQDIRETKKKLFRYLYHQYSHYISMNSIHETLKMIGLIHSNKFSKNNVQSYFNSSFDSLYSYLTSNYLLTINKKEIRSICIDILNMIKNKLKMNNYKYFIIGILYHVFNSVLDTNYYIKKHCLKPFKMTIFEQMFNMNDSTIYRYSHKIIEVINNDY